MAYSHLCHHNPDQVQAATSGLSLRRPTALKRTFAYLIPHWSVDGRGDAASVGEFEALLNASAGRP